MADLIPLLVFVVGFVALVRPAWIAAIDRRQRAAGTTRQPRDVKMSDGYYAFVRVVGGLLAFVGAILTLRSLA